MLSHATSGGEEGLTAGAHYTTGRRKNGNIIVAANGSIRIFVTGGTFDKEYNELTGSLFFKDTHLAEMLRLGPLPRRRVDRAR